MSPAEGSSAFLTTGVSSSARSALLARLEAYYDTAPRATARTEELGALVLFVAERGWPFYARPRLDRSTDPTTDEIRAVLDRQRELRVPRALEWVHENAPTLASAAQAAGMTVHECPMLAHESLTEPRRVNGEVRLMDADDAELGAVQAAIGVAFGAPGTALGEPGIPERDKAACSPGAALGLGFAVDALRTGRTVRVGAFVHEAGAVGGGSHNPRGDVSEMVGVGVLPAFRRRGLAAAAAHLLARHAIEHGVTTIFCGAESIDVARVYERVGFRRIGTTCTAEID